MKKKWKKNLHQTGARVVKLTSYSNNLAPVTSSLPICSFCSSHGRVTRTWHESPMVINQHHTKTKWKWKLFYGKRFLRRKRTRRVCEHWRQGGEKEKGEGGFLFGMFMHCCHDNVHYKYLLYRLFSAVQAAGSKV